MQMATQLTSTLTEAVATMAASVELKEPDQALLEGLDTKAASLGRAAADDLLVAHVADVLMSWCASVDEALTQQQTAQHEVSYFPIAAFHSVHFRWPVHSLYYYAPRRRHPS